MKLLITRPLPAEVMDAAAAAFDVTARASTAPLTADEMHDALTNYDVVLPTLGDAFSADVFARAGKDLRVRLLANFGVGHNHIDSTTARSAGVAVTNTPGAVTDATADIAMTLILMSSRRAGEGERVVRAGKWGGWAPTQMLGMHLTAKTVGIVGLGRIGQAIARRCHYGFSMPVRYFNRSEKALEFPATRDASILELAAQVDVLVVALPGGGDTRHVIDAEVFAAMPNHARFINIARGEIVDEAALITALQTGAIGGAGLDVYEFEPDVPQALIDLENATLLPHLGTAALEVRTDMGLMAVANLVAFKEGRDLPNPVT